jgi:putative colanic acid biosysnthesis UDP-glucose lipid carrier transferase
MHKAFTISSRIKLTVDLLLLVSSILIIRYVLNNGKVAVFTEYSVSLSFIATASWLLVGVSYGLYQDFRVKPFSYEWVLFVKTLLIYTLIISFVSFQFYKTQLYVRWIVGLHATFIFLVFPIQKLFIRIILKKIRKNESILKRVLIVGTGEIGLDFYRQFVKNHQFGYKLTGFVDEKTHPSLNGHYLGNVTDLENVITEHELDDIVIAAPLTGGTQLQSIVEVGEKEGKRIHIIPNYQHLAQGRMHISQIGDMPFITLRSLPLDAIENKFYKRAFDIVFSLLVIVLVMSWLMPLIALLIKCTSKGPVLFKQERWGLHNRPIICYKFRTMVASSNDVDENGNYLQAKKHDPRVTKIGKVLRKTSLDELPQFFNVLSGSMSVVGPRPHPVPLNLISKNSVHNYMMRHWVKPGITGWAQVKGYRGETSSDPGQMKKRVEADIWYMENWTFWHDLQIIVQTVVNMVKVNENVF